MKLIKRSLLIFFNLLSCSAWANADFSVGGTLPKGVRFFSIRYGMVSAFTQKFDSTGTLEGLDRNNIQMNAETIKKLSPQSYALLESVLNSQAMPHLRPADELNLGELTFNGDSNLNYVVPIMAFGVRSNWTVGLAVPVVNHYSTITVSQTGYNNSKEIFRQISGNNIDLNTSLGIAEYEMSQGPLYFFNRDLKKNGYKEIEAYEKQFIGDVKIASRVKIKEYGKWSIYLNQDFNLPTGPADDPDDLTDLPVFHKFYLENQIFQNYRYDNKLMFGLGLKYKINIPDVHTVRVPENEDSALISADRKETVDRNIADEFSALMMSIYNITNTVSAGAAFELGIKGTDDYFGDRNYNYSLLSKNTDTSWGIMRLKAVYSTVETFKKGYVSIPVEFGYAYSDMIMGRNIERQSTHEIIGKLYF